MAGCGSCSFEGGRRRKTRKSHHKRRYRGGSIGDKLKKLFTMGKSALHGAGSAMNVTKSTMGGGSRRKSMRRGTRKHYRHPKKGQRSRTRRGRLDFTTKKSSRVFNRRRHYQRRSSKGAKRRPFHTRRRR